MAIIGEKKKNLIDLPPLVKYSYYGRVIYYILGIMPVFSVFYQMKMGLHFYFLFLLHMLLFPHVAYLAAHATKKPKQFELIVNIHLEMILVGIWVPICLFHPMICLFSFFGSIVGMMVGAKLILVATRTVSLIFGGLLGGLIFGFNFSTLTTLSTIIWTSVCILGGTFATILLFIRTNKFMVSTRKDLKAQKALLEKELDEAVTYVKKMLPQPIQKGSVHIDWKFVPSTSLGGDAFGYHWLDNANLSVYLLDVSGHGVGAALLSASVLNVLRSESLPNTDIKQPEQVLKALNTAFPGDDNNDMFFTFWYGIYNTSDRSLTYAGAGHPPALLFMNESNAIELNTKNFVVGGMEDVSYKQSKLNICTGASLYIFSDGVYEVEQKDGSMWKFSDYVSLLSEINSDEQSSLDMLFDQTLQRVNKEKFEDDYTILRIDFT